MNKIISTLVTVFLAVLISNCGFKVLDKTKLNNFTIKEIIISGDRRINFKIRNNLQAYDKDGGQNLLVYLDTKKAKEVKEKNMKNEIVKYQIYLKANIKVELIDENKNFEINITTNGDYLVDPSYSGTLNNEKQLIDTLVEEISEKISDNISLKLNDI